MRIVLSAERSTEQPGWAVCLTAGGGGPGPARNVVAHVVDERWWPQPLGGDAEVADLFRRQSAQVLTSAATADPAELEEREYGARTYGKYLFETFVDAAAWTELIGDHQGPIELAVRCDPGDTDLNRLVWELMFDPERDSYLARDVQRPVAIVRQVRTTPGASARSVPQITVLPRLLHFAATGIADPAVRAGAEVVGVLQGMQRTGGVVDVRAAYDRSLSDMRAVCRRFRPHVVHLIAGAQWDTEHRVATLRMREDGGSQWHDVKAAELVNALAHHDRLPSIVVLSACETSAADPGMPLEMPGSVLAAQLVAAGVPIVVALTGAVSDIAYRLFVRALGTSIAKGTAIAEAGARARVAAFAHQHGRPPDPIGWALSAVFGSADLPEDHRPVTFRSRLRIRSQIRDLRLREQPVFCCREAFLDVLDQLLDPAHPRAVLLIQSRRKGTHVGGSRLLSELAGAALRGGSVPCVVGPFDKDAPRTAALLALFVVRAIVECRAALTLTPAFPSATLRTVRAARVRDPAEPGDRPIDLVISDLQNALEKDGPAVEPSELARALRTDLVRLVEDAAAKGLLPRPYRASPILLLDDVDRYGADARKLCGMLGTRGLHALQDGATNMLKIPVVIFAREQPDDQGTGSLDLAQRLTPYDFVQRADLPLLRELASADGADHDVLAWQWLLLNPVVLPGADPWRRDEPAGPHLVLTPRMGHEHSWHQKARTLMSKSPAFYDAGALDALAREGRLKLWFHEDDDDGVLRACDLDDLDSA